MDDIFFFARAPVFQFTERYLSHREDFVKHVEVKEIDRTASGRDLTSESTQHAHTHEIRLVHARSNPMGARNFERWQADGEDGVRCAAAWCSCEMSHWLLCCSHSPSVC